MNSDLTDAASGAAPEAAERSSDQLPIIAGVGSLAPGDECHFLSPVRFGRRRADVFGHLLLTSGWLKFRGMQSVSVAWSEVAEVQLAGIEIVVRLEDSRRVLRFACPTDEDAARGTRLAEYLSRAARERNAHEATTIYEATL